MAEKDFAKFVEHVCHCVASDDGNLLVVLKFWMFPWPEIPQECITATFHHHLNQLTSSCPMADSAMSSLISMGYPRPICWTYLCNPFFASMHLVPLTYTLSWILDLISYHPSILRFLSPGQLHLLSSVFGWRKISCFDPSLNWSTLSMFTVLPLHTFYQGSPPRETHHLPVLSTHCTISLHYPCKIIFHQVCLLW